MVISSVSSSKKSILVKEAIILAGGLGTRLRDAVPDLPKCMAPVAGQPFLAYVIRHLLQQGIERFIFSLGYKHEVISAWLDTTFPTLNRKVIIEPEPMGTGGAVRIACDAVEGDAVFIVNGDTLFRADLQAMALFHQTKNADCTMALRPMRDTSRYGIVTIDEHRQITRFEEKKQGSAGLINGGIYVLQKKTFLEKTPQDKFSFEREFLEEHFNHLHFCGFIAEDYFIDIGIPEDFERAQYDLVRKAFLPETIDDHWTLFLDRDGVINVNNDHGYILKRSEFVFTHKALDALKALSKLFGRIIVVTNQRGISKGLMTEAELHGIHEVMKAEIASAGGRIDDIFYCTAMDDRHPARKPNPGMALQAKRRYPEIDFTCSVMVGDKLSDMEWGRNIGAHTVLVGKAGVTVAPDDYRVDLKCSNLWEVAQLLTQAES